MPINIILTSCVNIKTNKDYIFQIDKNERLNVYLKSILQWLTKTNFNIILIDNSGHNYDELNNEKQIYKDRFEVISFIEDDLSEAFYLYYNNSKGASEIFAINYAFFNSRLINKNDFIIKITCRFFIPELQEYLNNFNLDDFDSLTQNDRDRCEMVGCHYKHFYFVFSIHLVNNLYKYDVHIENIWKERTSSFKATRTLICKRFDIENTQRGGLDQSYIDI
jgi:hypothetical protein